MKHEDWLESFYDKTVQFVELRLELCARYQEALETQNGIVSSIDVDAEQVHHSQQPRSSSGRRASVGTWTPRPHGAGVSFKRETDGMVVDVCHSSTPELFDEWELSIHLGSLGKTGVKMAARSAQDIRSSLLDNVRSVVATFVHEGRLTSIVLPFRTQVYSLSSSDDL